MKKLFLYLVFAVLFASCIQKEALNSEADIETCKVLNAAGIPDVNIRGNIIISNDRVAVQAIPRIDLTKLSLDVKLTEGATISPNPKEELNYSKPQSFVVTSQDGVWKKMYTISIDTFEMPTTYDFVYSELNNRGKYNIFYEVVQGKDTTFNQYIWASGNPGYLMSGVANMPEDYPTVAVKDITGRKTVKLETKSTGPFGEGFRMPMAAGNLFIGSFDVTNATQNALKATLFGLPFGKKPLSFSGHYKFRRGEVFTVVDLNTGKSVPVAGREDACDIYAVLYESEGLEKNSLNGADVLSSPNIVALARFKTPIVLGPDADIENAGYNEFKVDFEYRKSFDISKMKNYEYSLAVVFTSSIDGASFAGALGSVLYVDDAMVVCE